MINKEIKPTPFQKRVIESEADITLISGSMLNGKTYAMMMSALYRADKNTTVCMFDQHGADNLLNNYNNLVHPNFKQKHISFKQNNIRFKFGALWEERSHHDYAGMNIDYLAFDNLQRFEENVFLYLLSRNRSSISGEAKLYATICPYESISKPWIKDIVKHWMLDLENMNGKIMYAILLENGLKIYHTIEEAISEIPKSIKKYIHDRNDINLQDLVRTITFIQ